MAIRKKKNPLSTITIVALILLLLLVVAKTIQLLEVYGIIPKLPNGVRQVVEPIAELAIPALIIAGGIAMIPVIGWLGATVIVLGVILASLNVWNWNKRRQLQIVIDKSDQPG